MSDVPIDVRADIDGRISAAVDAAIAEGEVALQVCIVIENEIVADVAGGYQDLESKAPARGDSLFTVFSATKGIIAAAVVEHAARGVLDLYSPVAAHWPEFAYSGKSEITAIELLTHTAGIPHLPAGVSVEDMCDWERMTGLVAELEPLWRPGATMAYHAYTYGWAVGELLRRAEGSGRGVSEIVRESIGRPAGALDLWLGVPAEVEPQVVTLYRETSEPRRQSELALRALPPALDTKPEVFNRSDVRRACLPAAGGISSARSLALVYGMLATGGAVGGRQVIPEAWVARAAGVWRNEVDHVIGVLTARGLGFNVAAPSERLAPFNGLRRTLGHPGAGGSIAWGDLGTRAGVALTRSRMTADGWRGPVMRRLIAEVDEAVDIARAS